MRSMGTMAQGGISRDFSGSDKMPLGREGLNLRGLDISRWQCLSFRTQIWGSRFKWESGLSGYRCLWDPPVVCVLILCLNAHGIHM